MTTDFEKLYNLTLEQVASWKQAYDALQSAYDQKGGEMEEMRQKLNKANDQIMAVRKVCNHFAIAGNELMYKAVSSAMVCGLPPIEAQLTQAAQVVLKLAQDSDVEFDAHLGWIIRDDNDLALAIREYQRTCK